MSIHKVEIKNNKHRWLISYADFITLLFAFFVVMYSISSLNDDKYEVLAETFEKAFKRHEVSLDSINAKDLETMINKINYKSDKAEEKVIDKHPVAKNIDNSFNIFNEIKNNHKGLYWLTDQMLDEKKLLDKLIVKAKDAEKKAEKSKYKNIIEKNIQVKAESKVTNEKIINSDMSSSTKTMPLNLITQKISTNFRSFISKKYLSVRENQDWVEVDVKTKFLFEPGSVKLSKNAAKLIKTLALEFKKFLNPITVEGYTDNIPVNPQIHRSNWELSAKRAASVVRILINEGLEATRLRAIGYGENYAVGSNMTEKGRNKNRRVVIVIEKNDTRLSYLKQNSYKFSKKKVSDVFKNINSF